MATTPVENGIPLDQFNDALRQSQGWQSFMQRHGFRLDGSPIRLSDRQRRALQSELESVGVQFERGMEIDPAGNVNQDQSGWRTAGRVAVIGGAGLATFLTAGMGSPLLAAAIGSGTGALSGALSGGKRGALTGALTGLAGPVINRIASPLLSTLAGAGTGAAAGAATGGGRGALSGALLGAATSTLPRILNRGSGGQVSNPGGGGGLAPIPGIQAGTLPGGGMAPIVTPGLPSAVSSLGTSLVPLPGIPANTLPGGAASPVGAIGGEWSWPTIPGLPAGTLPDGSRAPNVTPSLPPGSGNPVTPPLGGMTPEQPGSNQRSSPLSRLADPNNLLQMASIIPALLANRGDNVGSGGAGRSYEDQLNALIQMAANRAQRTDPLHLMVTRLAESRMPINSRNL